MNLIRNIKTDLQRAFGSKLFLIGLLATQGICYLNIPWDNLYRPSVLYMVQFIAWGSYVQLIFVGGVVCYSTSYLSDVENHYIRYLVLRSDLRSYLKAKVITTAISGFITVFLGKLLFVATLRVKYSWVLPGEQYDATAQGISRLMAINPQGYILADAVLYALAAAGFAVLALLISSITKNIFVTVMSPIVLFFMLTSLYQWFHLPQGFDLNGLLMGYIQVYADNLLFTFLHIFSVWFIFIFLVGTLFIRYAERSFQNE